MSLDIPTITFFSALICIFFIFGGELLSIGEYNSRKNNGYENSEGSWLNISFVFFTFMFIIVNIIGSIYSCLTYKRCAYQP